MKKVKLYNSLLFLIAALAIFSSCTPVKEYRRIN